MNFSDEEVERYARHLVLREIGGPGQQALAAAKVLIVGAGGLGCPAALYLAAAGVGVIGLVDDDAAALSNLQRQVLYTGEDLGRLKVDAAAEHLSGINPHVFIEPIAAKIVAHNSRSIISRFDVVLDGTDDFGARFCVNEACVAEGKPLVSGAIGRWTGQIGVYAGKPCYRCLVPETPPGAETCSAVGVVGALAGVIGSMMALEAIKLITGAGEPLVGRMMIYDGLSGETRTVRVGADPDCPVCAGA